MPIVYLSLFILAFCGAGALFWRATPRAPLFAAQGEFLVLSLVTGLILSQIPIYIGLTLSNSIVLTAASGVGFFALQRKKSFSLLAPGAAARRWHYLVFALPAVVLWHIITLPLADFDARAIWFFQAKIIYFDHFLNLETFKTPEISFIHADYPKLLPILASQISHMAGYCNDFWPKLSLIPIFLIGQLAIYLFPLRRFPKLLVIMLTTMGQPLLWNGYLDLHLAIYTMVATVFLRSYLIQPRKASLGLGLAFLGLLPQLKNEGAVLMLLIGGLFLFYECAVFKRKSDFIKHFDARFLIFFVPTVLWTALKKFSGLQNYLSSSFSWSNTAARFSDPSFWHSLGSHLVSTKALMQALVVSLALVLFLRFRLKKTFWTHIREAAIFYPLLIFLSYSLVLTLVYLITPYSVEWQLSTSFGRVSWTLVYLVVAALLPLHDKASGAKA